jgi:hypothetical protein
MNPRIDPELNDFVLALLAKDPARRPADAAAVRSTLTRIRDRLHREAHAPTVLAHPLPRATPMACGSNETSKILWAADKAGSLRRVSLHVRGSEWSPATPDTNVPPGQVTAIAAVDNNRDVSAVAVVAGGLPYVTFQMWRNPWRSLCEAGPATLLRLPVTEIALTRNDSVLTVHAVDSAGVLWARSYDDLGDTWAAWRRSKSPVEGRITSIAIAAGGILDVVATAEGRVCYRGVPFEATRADLGRPIVDVAYVSAWTLKMHACLFALDDAGSIWQLWDWRQPERRAQSGWAVLDGPPGRVTGIAATSDINLADPTRDQGILLAVTDDDAIHHATYTLDAVGSPQWGPWTRIGDAQAG